MQELLRHASSRVTLDTYTQAVTLHKRKAQSDVIQVFRTSPTRGGWREAGPDGKRKHRRMVIGSINTFPDEFAARQAVTGLHLDMNPRDARVSGRVHQLSELADQYRQRELKPDTLWKTHSTKVTYEAVLGAGDPVQIHDVPYRTESLVLWQTWRISWPHAQPKTSILTNVPTQAAPRLVASTKTSGPSMRQPIQQQNGFHSTGKSTSSPASPGSGFVRTN
jgi:hypothetical protein